MKRKSAKPVWTVVVIHIFWTQAKCVLAGSVFVSCSSVLLHKQLKPAAFRELLNLERDEGATSELWALSEYDAHAYTHTNSITIALYKEVDSSVTYLSKRGARFRERRYLICDVNTLCFERWLWIINKTYIHLFIHWSLEINVNIFYGHSYFSHNHCIH